MGTFTRRFRKGNRAIAAIERDMEMVKDQKRMVPKKAAQKVARNEHSWTIESTGYSPGFKRTIVPKAHG